MRAGHAPDLPLLPRPAPPQPVPPLAGQGPVSMVCVVLPIKVISEANCRDHWRKSAPRKALHRRTAHSLLLARVGRFTGIAAGAIEITLTRIAPRTLDDDNLASGFKATRDGVADWLGIDDGSRRLAWRYGQRKGQPGQYAAEVVVMWGATC